MGVLSFTGNLSYNSDDLLLWSHYADGHRGFCLVIRDEKLYKETTPVSYEPAYPDLDNVLPNDPRFWNKVGLFKASQWSYENERRALLEGKANSLLGLSQGAIFAVIFGCWTTTDDRQKIAAMVLQNNEKVLFFEARVVSKQFLVDYIYATPSYRSI